MQKYTDVSITIQYDNLHTVIWRQANSNNINNNNNTIGTNAICTTQNLSNRMRRTNPFGILRYKRITKSRPDNPLHNKEKKRQLAETWTLLCWWTTWRN